MNLEAGFQFSIFLVLFGFTNYLMMLKRYENDLKKRQLIQKNRISNLYPKGTFINAWINKAKKFIIIFEFFLHLTISIVFYTLVDAMGVKTAESTQQFIVWLFLLIPIPMLVYSLANQKELIVSTFVENKYSLIVASIGSLTSYSLVLWAYTQAPIYYVASIRESSIIFASLIGLIFFKEKGLLRRLLASIVLFAGVVILEYSS